MNHFSNSAALMLFSIPRISHFYEVNACLANGLYKSYQLNLVALCHDSRHDLAHVWQACGRLSNVKPSSSLEFICVRRTPKTKARQRLINYSKCGSHVLVGWLSRIVQNKVSNMYTSKKKVNFLRWLFKAGRQKELAGHRRWRGEINFKDVYSRCSHTYEYNNNIRWEEQTVWQYLSCNLVPHCSAIL